MEFDFLQQARSRRAKRGWLWKRFWLVFSCGGLLLIGTLSLIKALRAGGSEQISSPTDTAPLETYSPTASDKPLPNVR
ncbi:hypothetical protein N9260_01555, partial [bacterium]|nr:hypothetical protein [bacterium]